MPVKPDCHCPYCKTTRGSTRTASAPAPTMRGSNLSPREVSDHVRQQHRPDDPPSLTDSINAKRRRDSGSADQQRERLRDEMTASIPAVR
jgi:hypothetical protein